MGRTWRQIAMFVGLRGLTALNQPADECLLGALGPFFWCLLI
jgi:hypothetical protein